MLCEKIQLNESGTANLYTYILEPEISYGVKRKWPAMIIVPGGGYLITATKEGEAVASQFLAHGFSCFVLKYSTYVKDRRDLDFAETGHVETDEEAHYPAQELQLMEAMHLIRQNAEKWNIDTAHIFTCGFSAGSHISGSVALRWNDSRLTSLLSFKPEGNELKPAGAILGYPMLGDLESYLEENKHHPDSIYHQVRLIKECLYSGQNPAREEVEKLNLINYLGRDSAPLFLWHTTDDIIVDPKETTRFVLRAQQMNVPVEYHLFRSGKHGLACANRYYAKKPEEANDAIALWMEAAYYWLDSLMRSAE